VNRIVEATRQLQVWLRHAQGRHPIVFTMAVMATTFLVVAVLMRSSGASTEETNGILPYVGIVVAATAVVQLSYWRPNGAKRAEYANWLERLEDETGWFIDPTGRHRLRFMNRARWTKWVADGDTAFLD
jgi:hypothetical protein